MAESRGVHHGTGPAGLIQTGIGPAGPVQRHKVRDRAIDLQAEKKIRFTSTVLPRWARRSRSLGALLGADAPSLSPRAWPGYRGPGLPVGWQGPLQCGRPTVAGQSNPDRLMPEVAEWEPFASMGAGVRRVAT